MIFQKADPLYLQVYERLKENIVTGEYKAGDKVVDSWIAKNWGVSRSPVREAFRKLEQDGLLINENGTTRVYEPNLDDVIDLFQVRIGLERQAAYMAAQLINDHQKEQLSESLKHVEDAIKEKRYGDVVKQNTFFHEFIIEISNNRRLIKFLNEVNTLTLLYRNNFFTKKDENSLDNDVFLTEHYEIFNALKANDAELAARKMEQHISHDLEYLKESYGNYQKALQK